MSAAMGKFTIHDLEERVRERAQASADVSYTRKLLDRGVAQCAKKLGEEAVETVLAAVGEDRERLIAEAADLLYHLLVLLEARGIALGRGGGGACRAHPQSGLEEKAVAHPRRLGSPKVETSKDRATEWTDTTRWNNASRRTFALPGVPAGQVGGLARRHADDAYAGRGDPAALAARPARHARGGGDLSAAVAAACRSMWRRPSGCSAPSSASSAPRTARCPTSSAWPARWRSANRPPRACCRPCWPAGPTRPRSISSPPTGFSFRTRCSSAKA